MKPIRIQADFNGLFGEILCLSHSDVGRDEVGAEVRFQEGMFVTAFDQDTDEMGNRDNLLATGIVQQAPTWLACRGSKWVLMINADGVRHESEIHEA